jgi:hypothetical protein
MRQGPVTISAAGMMATAAFFAPLMWISPNKGRPPSTIYLIKGLHLFFIYERVTVFIVPREKQFIPEKPVISGHSPR